MQKKTSRFWLQALAALAIGVLATSAQAKPPSGGGWVKHDKLSPVRGADGKMHTASCSGYPGTDPKFSFWARLPSLPSARRREMPPSSSVATPALS